MKSSPGNHVLPFIVIGLLIFLLFCPLPAAAIKVSGSMYSGTIAPGSSAVHIITVSTKDSDPPMDLMADIQGLGQTPQLGSIGLSADKDTSSYSARTFITANPVTFHLNPGESKDIKATITVPQNVGSGGRYAIITIHNAPVGNGTTAIVTAIAVPIIVTIQGTTKTMTGSIIDVSVADVVPGQPIKITTALKNTGNYHYSVINNVSITDSTGKVVAAGAADSSPRSLIPTLTGEFDVNIVTPLPIGTYSIISKAALTDGTVLDNKTIPFEIKSTYVVPSEEATLTLSPKSPAVLKTTDGRFTINFPAGAVLSDASVTLRPFNKDNLPPAPSGAKLGATTFRIDGLTGLLSKDATVVVKYSSADLEAAGSDVSKLALARYDESEGKWTIVPTTVDKNALTLTATTNRFSIWVVMVTSGQTAGGTGSTGGKTGLALDVTLVFAALGLTIAFVGHRIRK